MQNVSTVIFSVKYLDQDLALKVLIPVVKFYNHTVVNLNEHFRSGLGEGNHHGLMAPKRV